MMKLDKLLEAAFVASEAHKNQLRKGRGAPYIYHPLTVSLILSGVTKNKNVIIAGILHDVVEDTLINLENIESNFGKKVAQYVAESSEDDKSLSWKERKEVYLKKLKNISHEGALVKSADMLQNLYELELKLVKYGTTYFNNFNAPAKEKIEHEKKAATYFKKTSPQSSFKTCGENSRFYCKNFRFN